MATMPNLINDSTAGERAVWSLLKERLLPDDDWTVLFNQVHGNYESDFIVIGRKCGVLVIEVKDWTPVSILSENLADEFWSIAFGKDIARKKSPYLQVKDYEHSIMLKLRRDKRFMSVEGRYAGCLRVPVGGIVVFPNMTRNDLLNKYPNAGEVISFELTLFKDQLESLTSMGGPKSLSERLTEMNFASANHAIDADLTDEELVKLARILAPSTRTVAGSGNEPVRVEDLDVQQRMLAEEREMFGHSVIEGVVGSGKTMVLIHRALFLKANWPYKKILLTCYNVVLSRYTQSLLERLSPNGIVPEGIEVRNFHSLVYERTGEHDDQKPEFVAKMREYVEAMGNDEKYNAVLIDEGQDLRPEWVRLLVGMAKEGSDVTFAHDPMQGVYGKKRFAWKDVGIDVTPLTSHGKKKIHNLKTSYRSTQQIASCATSFYGKAAADKDAQDIVDNLKLFESAGDSYKPPVLVKLTGREEIMKFVASAIIKLKEHNPELSWHDFCVLMTDDLYEKADGTHANFVTELSVYLRQHFKKEFKSVVDRDIKKAYHHFDDHIKLMRLDACKGLEWKVTFVLGLDRMPRDGRDADDEMACAYVGITRASRLLVMPHLEEGEGYIPKIREVCDPLNKDLWGDVTNI